MVTDTPDFSEIWQEGKELNGMAEQYRLEMVGVSTSFPGVKALDGISLKVRPGTVPRSDGERTEQENQL